MHIHTLHKNKLLTTVLHMLLVREKGCSEKGLWQNFLFSPVAFTYFPLTFLLEKTVGDCCFLPFCQTLN